MKVGLITFFLLIFIQAKTQQKIDFQFAFNANAITLNKTIPFLEKIPRQKKQAL